MLHEEKTLPTPGSKYPIPDKRFSSFFFSRALLQKESVEKTKRKEENSGLRSSRRKYSMIMRGLLNPVE